MVPSGLAKMFSKAHFASFKRFKSVFIVMQLKKKECQIVQNNLLKNVTFSISEKNSFKQCLLTFSDIAKTKSEISPLVHPEKYS